MKLSWTCDDIINALETLSSNGVPPGRMAPAFDVGSKAFIDVVDEEIFANLVRQGGATCRFIEGPYGAGKTHLLHMLGERAYDSGMVVVSTELSRDLGIENWSVLTKYLLEKLSFRHNGQTVTSLPNVLAALADDEVDIARLQAASVPHASFRNAMVWAFRFARDDRPLPRALSLYLSGQRVPAHRLKGVGLRDVKHPLSTKNAEQVLNTVVLTLNEAGAGGTLLLFDEAERTLERTRATPSRKTLQAANLMRRLIDASVMERLSGVAAVFAVLPDFLQRAANVYPALGQRLQVLSALDNVAWRMPVQRIDAISTSADQDKFSAAAMEQLLAVAKPCVRDVMRVRPHLEAARQSVLEHHAGSGYRRPLMKQLADTVLQFVEE